MEKKKKSIGFKKIIVSILSILFVVCAYVPCISQVKADQLTYGIYTYQYGKASYVTEPFTSSNNTRWNYKTTIDFANNMYTSIDVAVTVNPLNNYTAVMCENCNLTYINVSSNLIVIRMKCRLTAKVEIYSSTAPLIVDAWNYGNPVTTYTDGNFDYDANINTYVVSMAGHINTIERYVGAVNRSIISLAGDLGYSSTHTLESDLNTIKTAIVASGVTQSALLTQLNKLADIDNKLTSINANISATNVGIVDMVDHLEDYFSDMQNVDNIYSKLTALNDKLDTIVTTLNNINTAVTNIDNQIDTISWVTGFAIPTTMNYKYNATDTYQSWDGSSNLSFSTGDIYLQVPTQATRYNRLFRLVFPLFYYNSSTNGGYAIDYVELTDSTNNNVALYYTVNTQNQFTVYFAGNTSASASYLYVHLHSSRKTGSLRKTGNWNMYYLPNTDIEYWQLLSFFDQYNMNRQLLSAIQGISINITQEDITEMNTNITEYNTTMTDINQIENNYINNFNTIDNNIDLSNNSSPSVNLVDARLQFNSVFNDITADLRIRGILIFVLICGIILILLGA